MKKIKKSKKYDKASKDLINDFEEQIIEFVIKEKPKTIEVKDRELNLPDRRIDSVFEIDSKYILNIEFQTEYEENIEFRVLLYNILLQVKYNLPVRTIIIYLTRKNESKMKNTYSIKCFGSKIDFTFEMLKVWELDINEILDNKIYGMYPLIALAKKDENLPKMVYDKIIKSDIDDNKKESLIKVLSTLLGLVYKGETIKDMLPVEKLEGLIDKVRTESEQIGIVKGKIEGEQIGIVKGKIEGEQIGIVKGEQIGQLNNSRNLVIRIIKKKFNKISKKLENKIISYTNLEKLENIIENSFMIKSLKEIEDILDS